MELLEIELIIYIKMDLALNNQQGLIFIKSNQPTNQHRVDLRAIAKGYYTFLKAVALLEPHHQIV